MREYDSLRIDRDLLQKFTRSIVERTGLSIRQPDWERLQWKITDRVRQLQFNTAQEYYFLLDSVNTRHSLLEVYRSEREWKQLINSLTVTESYFFRDLGQFNLLRYTILPKIIEKNQHLKSLGLGAKPSLKIWSAACASGEEPYSIAIVLKECLPDIKDWDISIIGTDINEDALERAQQGIYSPWSFRPMEIDLKQRYFQPCGHRWKLDQSIRNMVKFDRLNLVEDCFPNSSMNLENIDLILCRNVFIYFQNSAITEVLKKFHQTLRSGGYLMSAHGELQGQILEKFQTHSFCQSVIYQRPQDAEVKRSPTPAISSFARQNPGDQQVKNYGSSKNNLTRSSRDRSSLPFSLRQHPQIAQAPSLPSTPSHPDISAVSSTQPLPQTEISKIFCEAVLLFKTKLYPATIQKIEQLLSLQPRHLDAYSLIAQAYANLGDYQKATYYCVQAFEVDALFLEGYYLLAQISELQGNLEKAKNLLKQIIYIDPNSAYAYLELSYFYQKEGRIDKSQKMKQNAIDLLKSMPSEWKEKIRFRVDRIEYWRSQNCQNY
jgi:chemotaxis protein methyltransferase CheR